MALWTHMSRYVQLQPGGHAEHLLQREEEGGSEAKGRELPCTCGICMLKLHYTVKPLKCGQS